VPRKSKKKLADEPFEPDHAPQKMGARALVLAGLFAIASTFVVYNALALQPLKGIANSLEAQNAISLHYDPLVEETQRQLLAAGYFKGLVDGVLGEKTKSAIISYQAASGLSADGQPNQDLLDRIRLELKMAQASTYTASTGEVEKPQPNRNTEGRRIFLVQSALSDLGYDPGNLTGGMTDTTRAAFWSQAR
jgi:peptidoglycan hydrolase-like protein with peptidoglycan-binding domain